MPTYVWRDDRWVDKHTGEPMDIPEREGPCVPLVFSDLPAYRSPVTGEWIDGRRARADDLKKHNCVPYEPPAGYTGQLKNEKFAKKLGLSVGQKPDEAWKYK